MLPKRTGGVPLSGGLASAWHNLQVNQNISIILLPTKVNLMGAFKLLSVQASGFVISVMSSVVIFPTETFLQQHRSDSRCFGQVLYSRPHTSEVQIKLSRC
jgi:hypothetical protein